MNRIKNNNAGFTLLELIIAVAIISVVSAGLIFSASFLFKSRVSKAYNTFQTSFSEARTVSMSKSSSADIVLTYYDGEYYLDNGSGSKKLMSGYYISYKIKNKDGSVISGDLGEGKNTSLTVKFVRSTGGMQEIIIDGNVKKDYYLKELDIGGKVLYFTPETGRYSLEEPSVSVPKA